MHGAEFIASWSMKSPCRKRKCHKTRREADPEAVSAENDRRSRMQLAVDTMEWQENKVSILVPHNCDLVSE